MQSKQCLNPDKCHSADLNKITPQMKDIFFNAKLACLISDAGNCVRTKTLKEWSEYTHKDSTRFEIL